MRWALLCVLAVAACHDERETWVLSASAIEPLEAIAMAPPETMERLTTAPTTTTYDHEMVLRPQAERAIAQPAAGIEESDAEPVVVDDEETLVSVPEPEQSLESQQLGSQPLASEPTVAVARDDITWLEPFRAAYMDRQVALNDVASAISDPRLGVYVEDHRMSAADSDTPHMRWLGGGQIVAVSSAVDALIVGRNAERFGQPAMFTCDASRYRCQSTSAAPIGAYYRFAPLGSARAVRLVGVMYYDPSARGASVDRRIDAFDEEIDHELDLVE